MANYCTYQDRCHQEVEQKMRDFLLIPEAKEEIMLFLIQENFLNEERFARSYARGKFYIKHWGRNKIRQHLLQKGVHEKLIHTAFTEIDEDDYRATLKREYFSYFDKITKGKAFEKHTKTIRYCLSRGFEYELIREVQQCKD